MTESGKPEKCDIHAKVKRVVISPDLSKLERVQVDSKTILFKNVKSKKVKR